MFAIEYHCRHCKPTHQGRFFQRPDESDLLHYTEASTLLTEIGMSPVPRDGILPGDETDRLLRRGYRKYRQMFDDR